MHIKNTTERSVGSIPGSGMRSSDVTLIYYVGNFIFYWDHDRYSLIFEFVEWNKRFVSRAGSPLAFRLWRNEDSLNWLTFCCGLALHSGPPVLQAQPGHISCYRAFSLWSLVILLPVNKPCLTPEIIPTGLSSCDSLYFTNTDIATVLILPLR